MKIRNLLLGIFCLLLWFPVDMSAQTLNAIYMNYIRSNNKLAIQHMNEYGIPASIKLAQALLESKAGTSELARNHNNHFGIKCSSNWTGPCAMYADDTPTDRFRIYSNIRESYEDHSLFLQQNSRYRMLFDFEPRDYISWAKGLQQCGYATDRNYADKLIRLIEAYKLDRYDINVGRAKDPMYVPMKRAVYTDHGLLYVLAGEYDSYIQIAADLGFKARDLARYNETSENFPLQKGDIVYLEKKLKKTERKYFEHVVKAGESMHSISQLYGIQMNVLHRLNPKKSNMLTEGEVVRLQ